MRCDFCPNISVGMLYVGKIGAAMCPAHREAFIRGHRAQERKMREREQEREAVEAW